ncbi:hypothetical protein [Alkalihalobacillus deserti]|nr:hypothetical protein [Alkalihalobacillus deserti]
MAEQLKEMQSDQALDLGKEKLFMEVTNKYKELFERGRGMNLDHVL